MLRIIKTVLIFCLLQMLCQAVRAQNLVPNPDFESDSNVYCSWVTEPVHFEAAFKEWRMPTLGTSDYYSLKVDSGCFAHPFSTDFWNRVGEQMPHSDSNMAGFFVYGRGCMDWKPDYREFIQVKLKEPLVPGKRYSTGFFASLADSSTFAIKGIGFYFSDSLVEQYVECDRLKFTPQATTSQYITDTKNWVKVCESFVATSAAQYLIIGNFKNDSATEVKAVMDTLYGNKHAYYYLDDVYVRPEETVTVNLGPDKKKCINATVELDAGTDAGDFIWLTPKKNIVRGRKILAKDTGLYILKLLQCDTIVLDSIRIGNYPVPKASAGPDTAICYGRTVQLNGEGGVKYLWTPAEFLDDPTSQKPVSNTPQSRKYILTVTDINGCVSSDTVQLLVKPKLDISTKPKIEMCEGDTVTLTATTSGGVETQHKLFWISANGDTLFNGKNWQYSPKKNEVVNLVLEDGCSKPFSLKVELIVNKKPVGGFTQNPSEGCAPLVVKFSANEIEENAIYEWNFGDGNTSSEKDPVYIYTIPGKYFVTLKITSPQGCSIVSSATDSIEVYPNPVAAFSHLVQNSGEQISTVKFENYSTGATSVEWFIDEQQVSEEQSFTYELHAGKEYTVKLISKNQYGCTDTSEAKISLTELYSLYIPNVFTPNNDAHNNTFKPGGLGIESYQLSVYSRWGELLYEGQEWDGTYKGITVQNDVYLYMLSVVANDKRRYYYNGTVTVIK